MSQVRLILALHNHQPVGNFDGVFEEAYRTSYLPFLDVLEGYPEIPFVAAHLGAAPGMAGRAAPRIHRPAAADGRGRPGRDPGRRVLRADPDHDPAPGSGRADPALFALPRGALRRPGPRDVGRRAGLGAVTWSRRSPRPASSTRSSTTPTSSAPAAPTDDVLGYYLTEDDGRLLKVFPRLRDAPLHHPVPGAARDLRIPAAAGRAHGRARPSSSPTTARSSARWPETFDHVYTHGWLNRFCDMLVGNRDWLETTTFARAVDATLPAGQGLSAGRLVPRDDRVGVAARGVARRTGEASRRVGPIAGRRRGQAVLPRRRILAQLQGEVRRDATRCTPGCWASRDRLAASRTAADADPDYLESPARSSIAASATVPTGTARSAACTCRT